MSKDSFGGEIVQASPLNSPEKLILAPLQVAAAWGSLVSYPYCILTRKDFGERYISMLTACTVLQTVIMGMFSSIFTFLIYCAVIVWLLFSGMWRASLIYFCVVCVVFFVRYVISKLGRKPGAIGDSRYNGTPIIWDKCLQNKCSLQDFKSRIEPIVLIIIGVMLFMIMKENGLWNMIGWVWFFLASGLGLAMVETFSRETQINQRFDMMDNLKKSTSQQKMMREVTEQHALEESAKTKTTQNKDNQTTQQQIQDPFNKARAVRNHIMGIEEQPSEQSLNKPDSIQQEIENIPQQQTKKAHHKQTTKPKHKENSPKKRKAKQAQ